MEIEEGCNNLDKQVSGYCVHDVSVDAPKSMIPESDEETSKTVHVWEVNA